MQTIGEMALRLHCGSVFKTSPGALQGLAQLHRCGIPVLQNLVGQVAFYINDVTKIISFLFPPFLMTSR